MSTSRMRAAELPLVAGFMPMQKREKFVPLQDFGVITVPQDFASGVVLSSFRRRNYLRLYHCDYRIVDEKFKMPELLVPGKCFLARAWKQVQKGSTSSEERMELLSGIDSVHLGPFGLVLLFNYQRAKLILGCKYQAFDEKAKLPNLGGREHGVPQIEARIRPNGSFSLLLGTFEGRWNESSLVMSFNEI